MLQKHPKANVKCSWSCEQNQLTCKVLVTKTSSMSHNPPFAKKLFHFQYLLDKLYIHYSDSDHQVWCFKCATKGTAKYENLLSKSAVLIREASKQVKENLAVLGRFGCGSISSLLSSTYDWLLFFHQRTATGGDQAAQDD